MTGAALRFGFMGLPRSLPGTVETARAGEAAGFHWMGVADSPTVYQESYVHQVEAVRATKHLLVGPMTTHVVARHPVIVGNLLATLNELSGGRIVATIATGNSAARGLRMKPATVAELGQAIEAIRSYWRGEGGEFRTTRIPPTGLERSGCPIFVGADGPKATRLAGEVGDGLLYGGTLLPQVLGRRIAAGRTRAGQEVWLGPAVSLQETWEDVRDELGAMVVAMAFRGDLGERGLPSEIQEDVRAMRERYDYGFHADATRPQNVQVVSDRLARYLIEHFCIWGTEQRWRERLEAVRAAGADGVMFILGQADQPAAVAAIGRRLHDLGMLEPRRALSAGAVP